jgi:hypothetical protein
MDPSIIGWKEECEREHKANELLRAAVNDLPARETGLGKREGLREKRRKGRMRRRRRTTTTMTMLFI